ncbi:MAG: class II aldolase/adducin family protein [Armatimonadetes bacterium]|nr:class II aldolase/adducin family protein [Armatimonadota bacterium]
MPSPQEVLTQLAEMSRRLGDAARDYAILGEGNTSAAVDEETFFVKASGACLATLNPEQLVRVRRAPVLALLERDSTSDTAIAEALQAAKVDRNTPMRPSVETLFHAYLLSLPGIRFVGHTHPTAINALLCSPRAGELVRGRLFPDHIVCCGPDAAFVPYVDPGQPLACAIRAAVERYLAEWGEAPRTVYMQNHGFIALGRSAAEVESATAMAVKAACVLLGAAAVGGPVFLDERQIARIHTRPDEKYRQARISS